MDPREIISTCGGGATTQESELGLAMCEIPWDFIFYEVMAVASMLGRRNLALTCRLGQQVFAELRRRNILFRAATNKNSQYKLVAERLEAAWADGAKIKRWSDYSANFCDGQPDRATRFIVEARTDWVPLDGEYFSQLSEEQQVLIAHLLAKRGHTICFNGYRNVLTLYYYNHRSQARRAYGYELQSLVVHPREIKYLCKSPRTFRWAMKKSASAVYRGVISHARVYWLDKFYREILPMANVGKFLGVIDSWDPLKALKEFSSDKLAYLLAISAGNDRAQEDLSGLPANLLAGLLNVMCDRQWGDMKIIGQKHPTLPKILGLTETQALIYWWEGSGFEWLIGAQGVRVAVEKIIALILLDTTRHEKPVRWLTEMTKEAGNIPASNYTPQEVHRLTFMGIVLKDAKPKEVFFEDLIGNLASFANTPGLRADSVPVVIKQYIADLIVVLRRSRGKLTTKMTNDQKNLITKLAYCTDDVGLLQALLYHKATTRYPHSQNAKYLVRDGNIAKWRQAHP